MDFILIDLQKLHSMMVLNIYINAWKIKKSVGALFFDMSRIFDSLEFDYIEMQLYARDFRGKFLSWFISYLKYRKITFRWLSANALALRSRSPGFESWLEYGCLVAFFMCYHDRQRDRQTDGNEVFIFRNLYSLKHEILKKSRRVIFSSITILPLRK